MVSSSSSSSWAGLRSIPLHASKILQPPTRRHDVSKAREQAYGALTFPSPPRLVQFLPSSPPFSLFKHADGTYRAPASVPTRGAALSFPGSLSLLASSSLITLHAKTLTRRIDGARARPWESGGRDGVGVHGVVVVASSVLTGHIERGRTELRGGRDGVSSTQWTQRTRSTHHYASALTLHLPVSVPVSPSLPLRVRRLSDVRNANDAKNPWPSTVDGTHRELTSASTRWERGELNAKIDEDNACLPSLDSFPAICLRQHPDLQNNDSRPPSPPRALTGHIESGRATV
ncbi:hypothetical protein SCHPADRAFT_947952 [Schizopora paradoxa]|uniref:Uncharacterized protein n=1 Tax=Schizopora paradoxa TaxID=27342 RepID=A0A0H2QX27_9AGAM|nr:hypothetical protein SCHPADRAFT_947952 [Schizopora paradoxa]